MNIDCNSRLKSIKSTIGERLRLILHVRITKGKGKDEVLPTFTLGVPTRIRRYLHCTYAPI